MPIIHNKPVTPSQRFHVQNKQDVSKKRPERKLSKGHHRKKGRNAYGRITSRRRGGGHKRLYRTIDFKRNKIGITAIVKEIEYDPNRSANIALLFYADGEKRYIIAPNKLEIGESVISADEAVPFNPGNAMPLSAIPPSTRVHAIEMQPGSGAKLARSAGVGARLISVDGDRATLKMPSGEIRMVNSRCRATIGVVGNGSHQNAVMGKAGRNRWKGRRPRVRGVAMNPVDHPMGGGEGRTSGGG
ncbi:MAG: 50S ribosomal protein L2, partial [Opitutales bacterium]